MKRLSDLSGEVLGVLDLDRAAPAVERGIDVEEIADMRAVQNGRAEFRRLDRVLAASRRASDLPMKITLDRR